MASSSPSPHGYGDQPPAAAALPIEPLSPMNVGGMLAQPIASPAPRAPRMAIPAAEQQQVQAFVPKQRSKSIMSSWEERFESLKEYKERNGNCLVPGRYKEDPQLGRWVESQRKQYRQYMEAKQSGTPSGCAMNDDRIALLEGIGFVWSVRKGSRSSDASYTRPSLTWDQRLEQLKSYKEANGDCLVPYHYEQDPSLGRWVANQRSQYRTYMKKQQPGESELYTMMTPERVAALEAIGFEFGNPRDVRPTPNKKRGVAVPPNEGYAPGDAWEMDEDGFMPQSEDDDDDEASNLPPKKRRKTNETPKKQTPKAPSEKKPPRGDFGNKENKRKVWNERFEELLEYKKQHGDCNVPGRYKANPTLGRWVETQRKQYHRYTQAKEEGKTGSFAYAIGMDDENRIAKLNEIGFSWTVRGGGKKAKLEPTPEDKTKPLSWNERFEQLKAYKEENGDCLVPNNYEPNKKLGIWVANQRTWYRLYMKEKKEAAEQEGPVDVTNPLKEQRIFQLNELGFDWAPPRARRIKSADGKPKAKKGGSKAKKSGSTKAKATKSPASKDATDEGVPSKEVASV